MRLRLVAVAAALAACGGDGGGGQDGGAGQPDAWLAVLEDGAYDIDWRRISGETIYGPQFESCTWGILEGTVFDIFGVRHTVEHCGHDPLDLQAEGECLCTFTPVTLYGYDSFSEPFCICPDGDALTAEVQWTAPDGVVVHEMRITPARIPDAGPL